MLYVAGSLVGMSRGGLLGRSKGNDVVKNRHFVIYVAGSLLGMSRGSLLGRSKGNYVVTK